MPFKGDPASWRAARAGSAEHPAADREGGQSRPGPDGAVQLYAGPLDAQAPILGERLHGEAIIGATNGHIYTGTAPATRRAEEYTVRIMPYFSGVRVPAELPLILWQKGAYEVLAR